MIATLTIPWFQWQPIPVTFGGHELTIEPFKLTMAAAMLVALAVTLSFARRHERPVELTLDLAIHMVLFAFPVSYLLTGIFYEPGALRDFLREPSFALANRFGFSMYGGILGALLGAWLWKRRRKASFLSVGDPLAFSVPFAWSIGRVGCFGVHDHPGRVSDFFLAVEDYRAGLPPYQPRHDLGLYDAIVLACIAVAFAILGRTRRKPGFYVALLALLHAPARFFLDFLRAQFVEGGDIRYAGLTPSQYVAVGFFAIGAALMRRVQQSDADPS